MQIWLHFASGAENWDCTQCKLWLLAWCLLEGICGKVASCEINFSTKLISLFACVFFLLLVSIWLMKKKRKWNEGPNTQGCSLFFIVFYFFMRFFTFLLWVFLPCWKKKIKGSWVFPQANIPANSIKVGIFNFFQFNFEHSICLAFLVIFSERCSENLKI